MTKTEIIKMTKRVDSKGNKYLTIYFDYFGEERFTYLNKKALEYWKSKGITKFWIGQKIEVMLLKNQKHFKVYYLETIIE